MRWVRRAGLPAAARKELGIRPRERVLAAARLSDGGWAAATGSALVTGSGRIDWVDVSHAVWDNEASTLRVEPMATSDAPSALVLAIDDPGYLPEVLRERVTASIVASRHVPVRGRAGVRVVARRAAADDGLTWQVVVDRELDRDAPDVRAVTDATLAELRVELGE